MTEEQLQKVLESWGEPRMLSIEEVVMDLVTLLKTIGTLLDKHPNADLPMTAMMSAFVMGLVMGRAGFDVERDNHPRVSTEITSLSSAIADRKQRQQEQADQWSA